MNLSINSLNGGEFSPLLKARSDTGKFASGCVLQENFISRNYGPVVKRPGMVYLGTQKDETRRCRLLGFNLSVTTRFVLEFGHLTMRVWGAGGGLVPGVLGPYEIATPFTEAVLDELQFAQVNDVIFIAHASLPPMRLARYGDADWRLTEMPWTYPPLADENVSETALALGATSGTAVRLTASAPTFQAGHVGAYWAIYHRRAEAFVEAEITANNTTVQTVTSGWLRVVGKYQIFSFGAIEGTMTVERETPSGFEVVRTWNSKNGDRTILDSGNEERESRLRVRLAGHKVAPTGTQTWGGPIRVLLEVADARVSGLVKVTSVTSPTVATVDVVQSAHSTEATKLWAEGEFSAVRGFPRCLCLHQQRLIYGGSQSRPQSLFASVIGDLANFRRSTGDDSAWTVELAASEANVVQWVASQRGLIVGTSGEEWTVTGSENASLITPTSIQTQRQSRYGSAYRPAVLVNEVALFFQRNRRKLREFVFAYEKDGFVAPDLTLLSEHVSRGGIRSVAFQQQPDAILWCVTDRGGLVGLTYEREQQVVAWHRHPTDGVVESVATIYGDADGHDQVWVSVRRGNRRFIERFDPLTLSRMEEAERADGLVFLDAAVTGESETAAASVGGLEHLEGRLVDVCGDGAPQPARAVLNGQIILETPAKKVVVGLGYVARIQPNAGDVPMEDGTSRGRKWRTHRITLDVFRTADIEVAGEKNEVWDRVHLREAPTPMDAPPPLFTGEREVLVTSGFHSECKVIMRSTQPVPCCIRSLVIKGEVSGD